MYERREYPEKSWSFSRHKSFLECKRRFYFNTYGHWNGWEYNSSKRSKTIYRLKKLANIYTLSGQLLHEEIAKAISNKRIDIDKSLSRIRHFLNKAVKSSIDKVDNWKSKPKDYIILHEYYYGNGVSKEKGKELVNRMSISLNNFLKSHTWKLVKKNEIDIVEFEKKGFPHFMLRDYKIYSILDLFYKLNDKYFIVDWKSGKIQSEQNKRQMGVYALYVLNKYPSVKVDKLMGYNEYLSAAVKESFEFSLEDLVNLKEEITSSMEKMDNFLVDKDKNIPRDEKEYPAETGFHCKYCNYIELCDKGKEYLSS